MSAMIRTLRVASVTCLALCFAAPRVSAQTDPSVVGQWASVAPLQRYTTALHLLPTGMVMSYSDGRKNDVRLWYPGTGTTTPISNSGYDLFCSGHAFLADGRLLFAGGHIARQVGLPNSRTY